MMRGAVSRGIERSTTPEHTKPTKTTIQYRRSRLQQDDASQVTKGSMRTEASTRKTRREQRAPVSTAGAQSKHILLGDQTVRQYRQCSTTCRPTGRVSNLSSNSWHVRVCDCLSSGALDLAILMSSAAVAASHDLREVNVERRHTMVVS